MFFETLDLLPTFYHLFVDGAKGEITEAESSIPSTPNIPSEDQPNSNASSWGPPNSLETSGWGAPTSTEPENGFKSERVINNWEADDISSPEPNVEEDSTASTVSGWGSAVTADASTSGTYRGIYFGKYYGRLKETIVSESGATLCKKMITFNTTGILQVDMQHSNYKLQKMYKRSRLGLDRILQN